MGMKPSEKLLQALQIISGRTNADDMGGSDWCEWGYEPYNFSYWGKPSTDDLKRKAEEFIAEMILTYEKKYPLGAKDADKG